jgi:RNA polymerase sigma factor (sigma-70 family)
MNDDSTAFETLGEQAPDTVSGWDGDDDAVGATYLAHAVLLRRVAISKFRVPHTDADALVHDVFINYLAVAQRAQPCDVRGYLVAAICNASRNYWRSKRNEDRIFASDVDGLALPEASVEADTFVDVANAHAVASILARLGERCRDVLRRYYLEDEDTSSIAAAIRTTCSNVNYLMHSCRKRARAAYDLMAQRRW